MAMFHALDEVGVTVSDAGVWAKKKSAASRPSITALSTVIGPAVQLPSETVRGNEIFLMSQSRPIRGMHTAEGWTPETIAERVLPAMKQNFYPLESSNIVFSWDPV